MIAEAEKQLGDTSAYKDVVFKEKILQGLAEASKMYFRNDEGGIPEKELKYFTTDFKHATNLGKLYLLSMIHKRLSEVPGRLVISNCGTFSYGKNVWVFG